jgi:hypothetical protein
MVSQSASDGLAIVDNVLTGRKNGYFANGGIIKLNLILILSLVSSYATGYDGSMMSENLPGLDELEQT